MKKIVLAGLALLIVGCSGGSDTPGSKGDGGLEGTYFGKKERHTITIHKSSTGEYLIDQKALSGAESKDTPLKKASYEDMKKYFKNRESALKPGDYYEVTGTLCSPVVIKYTGDDDVYMANCAFGSPNKYERQ